MYLIPWRFFSDFSPSSPESHPSDPCGGFLLLSVWIRCHFFHLLVLQGRLNELDSCMSTSTCQILTLCSSPSRTFVVLRESYKCFDLWLRDDVFFGSKATIKIGLFFDSRYSYTRCIRGEVESSWTDSRGLTTWIKRRSSDWRSCRHFT